MAFSVRQYKQQQRRNNDWLFKPGHEKGFVENEFAVSISQTPQLSLNGQAIDFPNSESAKLNDGVKTAGKIALGVGVAVALVGAVGIIIIATNGGGCDE